eukprot:CAMPEP_0117509394 /NCGR_PEP_ID=MMETSP0784-20121206/27451_1 /TAXON_ID=39447 /ORGANISM="" /LENGTH=427 /DNA_ID=CAMNT_0005304997 /DNA_START=54 /DNA_END=1333 /DNA_ORIENTATION=+
MKGKSGCGEWGSDAWEGDWDGGSDGAWDGAWDGGGDADGWGGGWDDWGKGKGSDKGKGKGCMKGCMKGGKCKGGDKGKGGRDKGKGKAQLKLAAGEKLYHGHVRNYNLERKSGFIACEGVFAESGQEVYVFHDVLERAGAGPGDLVAFFLHWSAKGQPQASHPMIRLSAGDSGYALKGTFKPGPNSEKAFGFFRCDDTKEFFGRDVYVNPDISGTLTEGQVVSFNTFLNKDGMPNCEAAEPCDPMWEPSPGDLSASTETHIPKGGKKGGGGGGGKGKGAPKGGEWWPAAKGGGWGMCKDGKGGKGGKGKGRSGERGPPPTPTGRVLVGTIKSFSEKTGYGFISCDETQAEFGGDVFVSGKEINGATVGSMVTFNLVVSSKGQPQAQGVQTEGDAAAEPAAKKPRLEGAEHAFGGEEQAFGGEEQAFG